MARGFRKGDDFSDMSWERDPFESDQDYQERMDDLNDFLESFDD